MALPATILSLAAIVAGIRKFLIMPVIRTLDGWKERLDDIPALIRVVIGHIADADAHPHYWGMVPGERRQGELTQLNAEHIAKLQELLTELRRLAAREGDLDALQRKERRGTMGYGKHRHRQG